MLPDFSSLRIEPRLDQNRRWRCWSLFFALAERLRVAATTTPAAPLPEAKAFKQNTLWLAKVKNSTALPLLLPSNNPLRSLAEMAGKISPDYRQSVMDLLREDLRQELGAKRLPDFPSRGKGCALSGFSRRHAMRPFAWLARENFPGLVFVSEIWRWEGEIAKVRARLRRFQTHAD